MATPALSNGRVKRVTYCHRGCHKRLGRRHLLRVLTRFEKRRTDLYNKDD